MPREWTLVLMGRLPPREELLSLLEPSAAIELCNSLRLKLDPGIVSILRRPTWVASQMGSVLKQTEA